jgi:hypothetical protein
MQYDRYLTMYSQLLVPLNIFAGYQSKISVCEGNQPLGMKKPS